MDVVLAFELAVTVPVEAAARSVGSVKELDETYTVLDQATGQDAVTGKRSLLLAAGVLAPGVTGGRKPQRRRNDSAWASSAATLSSLAGRSACQRSFSAPLNLLSP